VSVQERSLACVSRIEMVVMNDDVFSRPRRTQQQQLVRAGLVAAGFACAAAGMVLVLTGGSGRSPRAALFSGARHGGIARLRFPRRAMAVAGKSGGASSSSSSSSSNNPSLGLVQSLADEAKVCSSPFPSSSSSFPPSSFPHCMPSAVLSRA
jgi:hypothetical protein